MEELVMKMKLMNRRRHSNHISSDSLSFSSVDDSSDISSTSDDADFWSPPQTGSAANYEDCWWSRPPVLRPPQTGGVVSELEMIKERFSRLLLGEDMTGSGRGFSTALAISNAIANLSGSIFGEIRRLEPLPVEKKEIWKREMEWLLSVADHIVEMTPSYKTFPNGVTLEIMACNQRSDLSINLPALHKLDGMLLELLDGFSNAEFWYVDQGKIENADKDDSSLLEKPLDKQKANWRLPVPQIPQNGLSRDSKTKLHRKRECASQILKAVMSINTDTISKMEVRKSYLESLPKTGKACLGDKFYKFVASEKFSVESVLGCLDLPAERIVAELANRLATAIYVWLKRIRSRRAAASAVEAERRELFCARAEDLLLALKQQFPQLSHTTLDAIRIQCNKDVGNSILESYSGVLKTLAYNIVARIDDLLSIETQANQPDKSALHSGILTLTQHTVSVVYPRRLKSNSSSRYSSAIHSSSRPDIVHFLDKVRCHKTHNRPPKESLG